jgi:glycosyltransferase involved in cell wall biosynthesis
MLGVLALVPYPTGRVPGQRYRIEQWAPLLRAQGVDLAFAPFLTPAALDVLYRPGHTLAKARATLRGHLRRVCDLRRAAAFDVAYVYREAALLGPAWVERRLARRLPFVFDFDDAIYLPAASAANAWTVALEPRDKTATICRLARHVIVGNETLAAFARRHARSVSVVPSTIDTDAYVARPRAPNPRPVIGWTGSLTTLPYLEALAPALRRLRARVDFELRVIGAEPRGDGFAGIDVRPMPWSAASEADDLRGFDVGLMPLPDDGWSRGKCGMKALQYMGLGIPAVVSPVGVNATLVEPGVSGFHARGDDEWVERLARLAGDPELRARLGAAGRRTVEAGYSARVQAPRVAEILRAAAGSGAAS